MPFVVACPKCGTQLRSATQLPAGRKLTCPACESSFTTRAPAEPVMMSTGLKARDGDEIPDAVILDEPDDDRPPADLTHDDDRPRPRRHRDEERRARAGARRKKRSSPAVVVGLIMVAFATFLVVGVLGYLLFHNRSKPAANDLLVYAPTDAVALSGYDLEDLSRNDKFRRALERKAPADVVELDRSGLRTAELARALVARTAQNGNTCAVRFKAPPDRSKYLEANLPGKGYASFTSLASTYRFGYFPDDRTLVLADKEPAIQALLDKGSKTRLSSDLGYMVGKVRGPIWRTAGKSNPFDRPRSGMPDDPFLFRVGPSTGTAVWVTPDGPMAEVNIEIEFENRGLAMQGASTLRGSFHLRRARNDLGQLTDREGIDPADVSDVIRGYTEASVSEDGNRVVAQLVVPPSEAMRMIGPVR
jgi:uncharacterized membrane protein